jgi:hypothetical protein
MTTNLHENFKARVSALDDEELVKNYLERGEYIALLEKEVAARGLSPAPSASDDANTRLLLEKKSDGELRALYLDLDYTPAHLRQLVGEEAARRGIPVSAMEKVLDESRTQGQRGKHVGAGYVLSWMGGLFGLFIALDYAFSKRRVADGTVYKYDSDTRNDGKLMLLIIAFVVAFTIATNGFQLR